MIKKILDNFFLRNLAVFLILFSVQLGSKGSFQLQWPITPGEVLMISIFQAWSYALYVFHNLVLYRKVWMRKKYLLYAGLLLLTIFCYRNIYTWLLYLLIGQKVHLSLTSWLSLTWMDLIYIYLALGVYLSFTYSRERERLLQIENEKKELELKQLNEQLNPHFLFNALNNIYSYLLLESANGRELILKLSELMRYILDSSKKELVPVRDEILFIEHYLAFEHERFGDRCRIDYVREEPEGDPEIVPLILFTFIENAFKHGTTSMRQSTISIHLTVRNNKLSLHISNPAHQAATVSTRIGLENTRRRLALLYPGRHRLDIRQTGELYNVSLDIDLQ